MSLLNFSIPHIFTHTYLLVVGIREPPSSLSLCSYGRFVKIVRIRNVIIVLREPMNHR